MEFRDLKAQYQCIKPKIDKAVTEVMTQGAFIEGKQVRELEEKLAEYVGVKYCISCANGTDALLLALMSWNVGAGDAVFVPDFTFFATAEVVALAGATPVFVDVERDTFNIDVNKLEQAVRRIKEEGKYVPKAVIPVDLFGQPADYEAIKKIAQKYQLYVLEDGAQGFGGSIGNAKACSFGDIATTSFFPAKPLGCYGDGGAVFTDNDEWAEAIRSYKVHGKGTDKYDNVRIGLNSRLDTMQAAILLQKFDHFVQFEIDKCNYVADKYTELLNGVVEVPTVKKYYCSGWAQYTIKLADTSQREKVMKELKAEGIPCVVYYSKPLHRQKAFQDILNMAEDLQTTCELCDTVLSLPMHPYLTDEEIRQVALCVIKAIRG